MTWKLLKGKHHGNMKFRLGMTSPWKKLIEVVPVDKNSHDYMVIIPDLPDCIGALIVTRMTFIFYEISWNHLGRSRYFKIQPRVKGFI